MKKLILLSAAVVAFGLAIPQMTNATTVSMAVIEVDDVNFEEIAVNELPQTISEVVTTEYATFKIAKAYKGNDGTFKLKVSDESGEKKVLFFDAEGKLIKAETAEPVKEQEQEQE